MEDAQNEPGLSLTFIDRVLMFTDIEGSSLRWDAEPEVMRALMRHHDAIVTNVVAANHGIVGARTGDGAIALFESAHGAASAALALHREIERGPDANGFAATALRVRIGLHRGVVEPRDGEHYGPAMHRTARIMSAAHGGQTVVSAHIAAELGSEIASELVSGPASEFSLVDRGVHRLRGFHDPEQLHELVPKGAFADPRGLRTTSSHGSLPPVDTDSFVGRDDDLKRILPQLGGGRLVTLVGTGGVGKTRLALQIAWQVKDTYRDGAWFVDLAEASGPDRVLPLIADKLGIPDDTVESLTNATREALHGRQMLVVLDNCEHVCDMVTALLRTICSPSMPSTILATSQRGLDLVGEQCESIAPLTVYQSDDEILGRGAGQLFVQAARRANPTLQIGGATSPENAAVVAAVRRICQRLEGLPLALELAAARARVMTIVEIADELQKSFDLLRSRDRHERHRTLAAAIGWSVGLLHDDDRSTLLDVSVFNGSFDWNAAAMVCGRDRLEVADSLDELVRRSLLVQRGTSLRMLVPLRLYCTEQLVATQRHDMARARHATWVAATLGGELDDVDPQTVAQRLDQLVALSEDLDSAHKWFLRTDPGAAAHLAIQLGDAWIARGRISDALERLRELDTDAVPVSLRVEVLGWLAAYGWTIGNHEEGETAAERALGLAQQHQLPIPAFAGTRLAVRYAFSNRPVEARELVDKLVPALETVSESNAVQRLHERSRHLGPLGVVLAVLGDTKRGIELADAGVALARPIGALRLLSALANRILLEPTTDAVIEMTREVAALASVVGRTSAQAHAIAALAHRSRRDGDLHGFLGGISEFAGLLLNDEPTSVLQLLQWVPSATAAVFRRETVVLLAALESLAEAHNYQGTEKERGRRAALGIELHDALGPATYARAWSEGAAHDLAETVDLLNWMTTAAQSP